MKAIAENLCARGKGKTLYVRKRIPADLRASYPPKREHVQRSLRTSDVVIAKRRLNAALVQIEAEFHDKRKSRDLSQASRAAKRLGNISDEQLQSVAQFWLQQTLAVDE